MHIASRQVGQTLLQRHHLGLSAAYLGMRGAKYARALPLLQALDEEAQPEQQRSKAFDPAAVRLALPEALQREVHRQATGLAEESPPYCTHLYCRFNSLVFGMQCRAFTDFLGSRALHFGAKFASLKTVHHPAKAPTNEVNFARTRG